MEEGFEPSIAPPQSNSDFEPSVAPPELKKKVDTSYSPSFVLPKKDGTLKSENGDLGQFAPDKTVPLPKIVEPKKQELKDFNRPLVNPRLDEIVAPIDHRKQIDDAFKITVDKHKETKNNIAQVNEALQVGEKTLKQMSNQMIEVSTVTGQEVNPVDQQLLAERYNKVLDEYNQNIDVLKQLDAQRIKEANRISTLFRGKQVMDKPVDSDIGAWEILGKSFTNAITGIVGGLGSTVEALGDLPMTPQGMLEYQADRGLRKAGVATPERDGDTAITDKIGDAFRDASKAMKLYIPKESQESVFEGDLTWKKAANTAGQVLGSIGAVVATGGVGGAVGASSAGIAMTMNDTYNSAKENGLSDEDAAFFALPVSIASGLFDWLGAGSIIKNISKKEVVNQLVKNSAEELAGKKITEQAVMGAMDNSVKKLIKDIGTGVVKSGVPEAGTEMGQSLIQSAGENLSDIATGQDNFQTKFFSKKTLIDAAENGLLGFGAGGALGGLTSIKSPQNYKEALKLKDPANAAQYGEYIDAEIAQGRMTPQQKVDIENNVKKTIEVDAKIPEYIKSDKDRYEASQLIEEKQGLQEQAKGLDGALATPMNDRIAQIDEELIKIANKNGAAIPIKEKPEGYKISNTEVLKPKVEELVVAETAPTENINQLKTTENATKEGNITENNQQQYKGATELQQGEQTNRGNQEGDVTTSQAETSGSDSSIKSGEKQKEVGSVGVGGDVVELSNGNKLVLNKDRSVKAGKNFAFDENSYDVQDKDGNKIGNIHISDRGDYYQISNVNLKNERTGLGTEIYKKLISELDKPLISDKALSEKAKGLWDKLVKNGLAEKFKNTFEIGDKTFTEDRYRTKAVEQSLKETPQENIEGEKQQIENFGVNKADVEPVHNVISQVFQGLKKAGLTAVKTVGEWVGIGKGEEKPYSLKINGKDTQVKNVAPEVVNGFYSPLEKTIGETKFDKLPAKQWIEKFAKGEEAKWTGLNEWLSKQEGSVSKSDIQQYLKDNRIQVVEVVKGGENDDLMNRAEEAEKKFGVNISLDENPMDGSPDVIMSGEKLDNMTEDEIQELQDEVNDFVLAASPETKFSQYQLEGEKSNYKEVLVTLPSKSNGINEYNKLRDELDSFERSVNTPTESDRKKFKDLSNKIEAAEKKLPKDAYIQQGRAYLKDSGGVFKSSHFDEPNILVHLRMNTRTDAEGNKVLFIEEVQSDWGQKGKKEGFKKGITENDIEAKFFPSEVPEGANPKNYPGYWESYDKRSGAMIVRHPGNSTKAEVIKEALSGYEAFIESKVQPTAPFVTDTNAWTKLGLKYALKEAVAQGADKIAWTTGEQQNERYDLSKQVDKIEVPFPIDNYRTVSIFMNSRSGGATIDVIVDNDGKVIEGDKKYLGENLENIVGKDITEKIMSSERGKTTTLEGEGLKIGGKGMKGFYGSPTERAKSNQLTIEKVGDKFKVGSIEFKNENEAKKYIDEYGLGIVGNVAKSLFKQEPKTVEINKGRAELNAKDFYNNIWRKEVNPDSPKWENLTDNEYNAVVYEYEDFKQREKIKNNPSTQHSIDITPELKASVEGGQPLFKDAQAQYRIENGKNIVEAIKEFNGSPRAIVALSHEIMHPTVVAIIDGAKDGNEVGKKHTQTIVDEYNKANPKNKVTVEQLIEGNEAFKSGTTSKQYRAVQEFIAQSWEKYHTEGGKGFSAEFQKVLDQITEAFKAVYKSISGKELTPELRKMFDEILGKESVEQTKAETKTTGEIKNPDLQTFTLAYAPFRAGKIENLSDTEKAFSDKQYQRWRRMGQQFASDLGLSIGSEQNSIGIYEGTSNNPEASVVISITGAKDKIDLFAAIMGTLAPEGQESVMRIEYDKEGSATEFNFTFKTYEDAVDFVNNREKYGVQNVTLLPNSRTIVVLDFGDFERKDFANNYGQKLIKNGQTENKFKGESAFEINENTYGRIISEARSKNGGYNRGEVGDNLADVLSLAEERAGRLGGDYGKKSEQAQGTARGAVKGYVAKFKEAFGIPSDGKANVSKVNVDRAKRIAEAYAKLPVDDSKNPEVISAYNDAVKEINEQYEYLTKELGLNVVFSESDPYPNSDSMFEDIIKNKTLRVFKGGEPHPFMGESSADANGITANEKLRAVHDYFGHFVNRNQFGSLGEERAWVDHSQMFSPNAQRAVTTETRGQNSVVNFSGLNAEAIDLMKRGNDLVKEGKVAEGNKLIAEGKAKFQFAEQKVALLPKEFSDWNDYKGLTEKEKAQNELDEARLAFRKAMANVQSGGFAAIPEFVRVVNAYVKMGILTAKDFIKQFRKDFPESKASDFDLANGFNESKPRGTAKEIEQSVSQHYQTVSDNVDTPAEWTANAKKDPAMYDVITNKETLKEAKKFIRNAGTIQDAANKLIESGSNYLETPLNVQVGAAYMLYGNIFNEAVKSRENGDIETATSLFEMSQKLATAMSQKLTKAGQGIQAASFLLKSLQTIEGVNMMAQKAVEKNNEVQIKKGEKKAKKQAKQISDVIKEAEEKTFATIEEKFKETTEAKLKRIKAKREKLKAKYKGVKLFSSTAVPGLTKDGIEYAGNMLATYVEEGIVKTEELYKKLAEHFKELGHNLSDEDITNIQDKIAQNKKEKLEGQVAEGDIGGAMKTVGLGTTISQIARRHYSEIESTREQLKNSIVDELGLTDTEAQKVADFIEAEYNKNVKTKVQELLTKTKEKKYTVKQKLLSDTEKLLAANKAGVLDEKVIFDLFKEKYKIAEWTLEDAEYTQKQLEKIAKVEDGSFKAIEYYENILNRVNSKKSFDLMTAMDEAWYGSVLSGGGTTDQNVSFGVLTFQNAIYEQAISKLTEGVVSGKPMFQLNNLVQSLFSLKQGMSNTINNAKYILKHGSKSFADDISQLDINARGEIDWSKANLGLLNAFKYSTRFLSAQDAVFTGNIKNWFLAPHLQDFYKKQGLSGKELNNAVMNDLLKVESKRVDAENQAKEEEKLDYEIVNKNEKFYVNYKDKPHKIFTTEGKAIEYIEEQSKGGLVYKRRVNEIMNSEINKEVLKKSAATAKRYVLTGIPTGTAGSLYQLLNKGMSALREKAQKSDNAITKGAVFGLTKVIPFIKVPLNIVDFTIDYTPLGYMRAFGKRGIVANFGKTTAGGREDFGAVDRNLLLIRATQGTAILATYIMKYMFDDDDKEEFNKDAVNDFNKRFGTDIKIDNPLFKMPKDGELVGSLGYLDAPQKKFLQDYGLAAEYSEYDAKSKTWKSFLNNPDGFMKGLVGTLSSYDKYIFKNKYQKTQSQMEKNSTPMMLSYLMFGTIDQFLQQSSLKGAQTLVQNLSYQQGDVGKKATELAKTVLLQPLAILNPALLRQAVKYWDGVAHEQINPLEKNEKGELNQIGNFLMQYLPVYGSFVMGRPRYNMFGQEIKQLPGERTGNFTNAIAKATGDMSKQNIVSSFLFVNGYTTPKIIPNNLMAIKGDGSVIYITDEQKSRLGAAAGRKAYDEILKRIEGKTDENGFIVIDTKFNSEGKKVNIKRRSLVTIVNKMKDKDRMKRSVPFNKEINSIFNKYYDEVWKDEIKKQGWVFTKPK